MIERDILIDLFSEYLEVYAPNVEEEEARELEEAILLNARERAFHYLGKFFRHGWLIKETKDYSYVVTIPDYAIRLLDSFEKISIGYQMEFRGQLLSIYQNLTGEESQSYIAIKQAYETTHSFVNGLKELNHNIKRYTEILLDKKEIKEVAKHIFDDYIENILGPHYYRLKSSDHISKYRTKIISKVNGYQLNTDFINEQAKLMVEEKEATNLIEAEKALFEWLEYIYEAFKQMDDILEEIDKRNRQYMKAARAQVQYLIQQDNSIASKVNQILRYLSLEIMEEGDKEELMPEWLAQIGIYQQDFFHGTSMKSVSKKKPNIKPTPLSPDTMDPDVKKRKIEAFKKHLQDEQSIEKTNEYVIKLLGDKKELYLSEFPTKTNNDWMHIIHTVLYGKAKKSVFTLSNELNPQSKLIKVNRGWVPNRKITRRKG